MVYTFKPAPVDYIQCCQLHLCPKCKKNHIVRWLICHFWQMTSKLNFKTIEGWQHWLLFQFLLKIVLFTNIFKSFFYLPAAYLHTNLFSLF